jgi:hypothetical protein
MADFWDLINRVYDKNYMATSARTKHQVVVRVLDSIDADPSNIFLPSYNPLVHLLVEDRDVYLPEEWIEKANDSRIKTAVPGMKYDCILALDEHLTYFPDENLQKDELARLANMCDGWLITTLVDYKNLAPFKKNQVELLHDFKSDSIFLEQNSPSNADKQSWNTWFYGIVDRTELLTVGPIPRRTLYFKQLAKYSLDLGSKDYAVQRNTLYRGFGRKHWEHIITIRF